MPLLVNMQPAGEYLGEEYYRAGGLPAVMHELLEAGRLHGDALTINGKTVADNVARAQGDQSSRHPAVRRTAEGAGRLQGPARQSVRFRDHEDERDLRRISQALSVSDPKDPDAFEGRAVVFDGPEDYHRRIDDPALGIDEHTILFMRGAGPIGYPGSAEVVNMQPPAALIKRGVTSLPCLGDGRQSGTSGSPSILNASPEAAVGGGLALLKNGDRVRIDLKKGTADMLISAGGTGGAARSAEEKRRLSLSAEPDAVAGNPARDGRSAEAMAWCLSRRSNFSAWRKNSCRETTTD